MTQLSPKQNSIAPTSTTTATAPTVVPLSVTLNTFAAVIDPVNGQSITLVQKQTTLNGVVKTVWFVQYANDSRLAGPYATAGLAMRFARKGH